MTDLTALRQDPEVREAFEAIDRAYNAAEELSARDALLAAVERKVRERLMMDAIQTTDQRLQDLLRLWSEWKAARDEWWKQPNDEDRLQKLNRAEAALLAWKGTDK